MSGLQSLRSFAVLKTSTQFSDFCRSIRFQIAQNTPLIATPSLQQKLPNCSGDYISGFILSFTHLQCTRAFLDPSRASFCARTTVALSLRTFSIWSLLESMWTWRWVTMFCRVLRDMIIRKHNFRFRQRLFLFSKSKLTLCNPKISSFLMVSHPELCSSSNLAENSLLLLFWASSVQYWSIGS